MQTRKQYMLVETLISIAINVALSLGFVQLVFHGQVRVPTLGKHGIVLDMFPQTFMVTLMGSLVPMLLTRRRLRAGALPWSGKPSGQTASPFPLALSVALLTSCVVVAACWIVLPLVLPEGAGFHALLISKGVFGGLLALAVTPWAIARVLR